LADEKTFSDLKKEAKKDEFSNSSFNSKRKNKK
jgi:hypothetical protein